ncbi:transglycosylase family protein,LysM domain-containing protein [Spongiibacter sp. IMCC21906]|uniref:LysM peptidoglycan-binding domain-containing protein n=1 Tax=Spongiibacter sp. IMCC21906 TaxID=1620392 RepID=UPI00062DEFBB|nr:LysM peptidoglycan-binding domain-containing protein [Spongiibacter sp. IMCC21906]AKH69778.1 transglycosylase family protein,LysM domain-containing protein [Spongiibacter sp. IMCC21906]
MKNNNSLITVTILMLAALASACAPVQQNRRSEAAPSHKIKAHCSNTGSIRNGSCELVGISEERVLRNKSAKNYRYDGKAVSKSAVVKKETPPPSATAPQEYDSLWLRLGDLMELEALAKRAEVEDKEEWYAKHPYYLGKVSKRSSRYIHYIMYRLEKRGLPLDLALLPIVESAYDPLAYSHGRAAGLWQFIPSTAKHVGIKQDWWFDGRRDVIDATEAALDYLEALNKRFDGDWLLTLAAYNAGGGTVNKAIRRNKGLGRDTDFWSLKLPKETRDYVPKFLALIKIYKNPASYNVNLPTLADAPHFAVVNTGSQIDLAQAAKLADISVDELYRLNPGFNRWMTSPEGPHRLLIPNNKADIFRQRLAQLPPEDRINWQQYAVKRGDNLTKIARANHVDVATIKANNKLKSNNLQVGQLLLIPDSLNASGPLSGNDSTELVKQFYTVRPGDTLGHIAEQHNVSVKEITSWNKLKRNGVIRPGQKLAVWVENEIDSRMIRKVGYKVRKGDSLARIASRFKVEISDIVSWNKINPSKYLRPGQSLTLYVDITRDGL